MRHFHTVFLCALPNYSSTHAIVNIGYCVSCFLIFLMHLSVSVLLMSKVTVLHKKQDCNLLCVCLADFSRHGSSQKDEVSALQSAIASLDREKDALQDAVDQKTESMVLLKEEINRKVLLIQ